MGTIRARKSKSPQETSDLTAKSGKIIPQADLTSAASLDNFDAAILRHLARHGRATNYEVGEAVGLSASAASRRIQALESSGAIRGYRAIVDDSFLGKRMTVYIRVTL